MGACDLALLQGLPGRALARRLRARLPVAEHLDGPRAALQQPTHAEARAVRSRDGAVGGFAAGV